MGVIRYKIWYDLWKHKSRTVQIILIIAMGAAAIGMIIGTRNIVIPNMAVGWQSTNPAMINMGVAPPIDDNELLSLNKIEGVVDVEGQSQTTIEWRLSPDDEWTSGGLTARVNYENQTFNQLGLVRGQWPKDKVLALERGHMDVFGIPESGEVYIRINDRISLVKIDGTVYNQLAAPVYFGGTAQFYISRDHYKKLVGDWKLNRIMATAAEYDVESVTEIADRIVEKLEKQGKDTFQTGPDRITDPKKHFFQDFLDGLFFLLGFMGLLALVLGLLLVYNTVNALISQQVAQIGIMKAIGARTSQIFAIYLTNIFVYGFFALLLAVPVGTLGAWAIASWLITNFNGDPGDFVVSEVALIAQVVIALLAPLIASLIPIYAGARITVRQAISSYGLSTGGGWLDRMLAKTEQISRMILLTITNTFRNKWRVFLMQVTLVISGLIFMMVLSVRDSVVYTFDDILFSILNYDINFIFEKPERIQHAEQVTLAHPEVKAVEMWAFGGGNLRPTGKEESEDDEGLSLFGVPLPTQLYGYELRAGRWLMPEDTYAIVLNQKLAEEAGVGVGDWITIKYDNDKEGNWLVVGLLFDPVITESAHVPRDILLREMGRLNKASTIWIQTIHEDAASQAALAKELRSYYKENQLDVGPQRGVFGIADTAIETGQTIVNQFNFVIILLGIMAVIIGTVGSIALSSSLSLSVMERRREIGVMRAIGATSGTITRLFISEGLLLGWLSWLIALPFSLQAGPLMLQAMSTAFSLDLVYRYTPQGAIYWLAIITVLSIMASWFPARNATRISVRESLAYQ